jgi:hypothetical protein
MASGPGVGLARRLADQTRLFSCAAECRQPPSIEARERVTDPLASTISATDPPLNRPFSASEIDQMVWSAAGMGCSGLSASSR